MVTILNYFLYFLLKVKIPGVKPLQGNSNNIIITDYRSILIIEFVSNKTPSFCFKAAYLSGSDSQYTP